MVESLSTVQKQILQIIQDQYPIEKRPYQQLATYVNSTEEQVISELEHFKKLGLIRRIGAFFDARRLGYFTTLIAAQVPNGQLDKFVKQVNALSSVGHNYGRDHLLNVWFTMTVPNEEIVTQTLRELKKEFNLKRIYHLPALKTYKLKVRFDVDSTVKTQRPVHHENKVAQKLSSHQKTLIRHLQQDMPLSPQPFQQIADMCNQPVEQVIEQIKIWIDGGVIRRFGAAIRHHQLGFTTNTMAVFMIPPGEIDTAGRIVAQSQHVSHCYQRLTTPDWPYNLYAMVHCQNKDQIKAVIQERIDRIHPVKYELLPTIAEYKKVSTPLFTEP